MLEASISSAESASASTRPVVLSNSAPGFMTPVMDFEILGLLFRFGGQRTFQPFDAAIMSSSRGREFADQIPVADTHIDDLFVRTVGRTQKIVHHGELEKLADVSLIVDQGHIVKRRHPSASAKPQRSRSIAAASSNPSPATRTLPHREWSLHPTLAADRSKKS